jgi:hypothetical protein
MQVNQLSYSSIHIQTKRKKAVGEWRELNTEKLDFSTKYYLGDQTEEEKISESCGVYIHGAREIHAVFWEENLKKEITWIADTYTIWEENNKKISKKHDGLAWTRLM